MLFLKFPNSLFRDIDNKQSIIESVGEKGILAFTYFMSMNTEIEIINFTLEDLILYSGFKPNRREGGINEKFIESIMWLKDNKYIINCTFDKDIKQKSLYKCSINNLEEPYFKVYNSEILKLYKYDGKLKKTNLIKLFLYIKSKIYRRSKTEHIEYDKYEVCFPSYKNISDTLHIGETNILPYINELKSMDLISFKKIPDMISCNGEILYGCNVYTDCIGDTEEEISGAIDKIIKIRKSKKYTLLKENK